MESLALSKNVAVLAIVAALALLFSQFLGWSCAPATALQCKAFNCGPLPKPEGVLKRNHKLKQAVLVGRGKITSPEDVAVDQSGRIYAGSAINGKIYRISGLLTQSASGSSPFSDKIEVFADPGGLSLGLKFDADENLVCCNAGMGLISVDKDGRIKSLVSEVGGRKLYLVDDLDIASDGRIYFTEATTERPGKSTDRAMVLDLLEEVPHGSLFVYDPKTKETTTLLNDLYFANGVAVSKDNSYVLVSETFRYRVRRYWLTGPKAGTSEVFADNLPGLPDGITTGLNDEYWVALVFPRNAWMDFAERRPKVKELLVYLPRRLWAGYPHHGWVLRLDLNGKITDDLEDPSGHVWSITNAVPWRDSLLLGSLRTKSIALYKVKGE